MTKETKKKKNPKEKKDTEKEIIKRRLYVKEGAKNKGGAKSKFDDFHEEIISRSRLGSTKKDRVAGLIHDTTYDEWINAGNEDLRNGLTTQYSEFSLRIRAAENEFRESLRASIKMAAAEDWKAATWLLERSDPDSYKLKDKVDVKQEVEISQKAILEIPDNGRRNVLSNLEE